LSTGALAGVICSDAVEIERAEPVRYALGIDGGVPICDVKGQMRLCRPVLPTTAIACHVTLNHFKRCQGDLVG
jgi:hypothetical protein